MNTRRITRLVTCAAAVCTLSILPAVAATPGYRGGDCGDFTVAVIPDTQNYVDYRHQKWSGFPIDGAEQFYAQMQWIADNARSGGGDIVFATHVGDIWQHYSEWMDPGHAARGFKWMRNLGGSEVATSPKVHTKGFEIPTAIRGFELIAGKLPFSVVPGNHDLDALWTDPAHPPRPEAKKDGVRHAGGLKGFQSAFSDSSPFFAGQPWYVGSHDGGADSAQIFTAGRCRLLHIGLQYHAPDASLAWAGEMIRRHPGLPTIVSMHDYLHRNGQRHATSNPENSVLDPQDNNPKMIWDEFIARHDQIFMVLSGHVSGQGYSVDTNRAGHSVQQIMADYQSRGRTAEVAGAKDGKLGDGWLRLLKFRIDGDAPSVEVRTFSTHYGKFASEIPEYAAWYKERDGQSPLTDAEFLKRDEFTIPLSDFHKRFGKPAR